MGNKLEDMARFFWEEDLAALLTGKQIDKLNVLQSLLIEVITPIGPFYLYLHHRALKELLTTNHGGTGAPELRIKKVIRSSVNFCLRNGIRRVRNPNSGPCQPVLVSTSQPNSLPLPSTNKSTPNSSGFSMQLYPSLTQNCLTAFFASAL